MSPERLRMFDYKEDIIEQYHGEEPSKIQKIKQNFSPKRLGSIMMIEFQRLCNKEIDITKFGDDYGLKFDKIICFKYSDLPLKPFFFTVNAQKLLLLKDVDTYNTMIVTDLNTVINILYENITPEKARRDGKLLIYGDRISHDEVLFFEIFNAVAPSLRNKIQIKQKP